MRRIIEEEMVVGIEIIDEYIKINFQIDNLYVDIYSNLLLLLFSYLILIKVKIIYDNLWIFL